MTNIEYCTQRPRPNSAIFAVCLFLSPIWIAGFEIPRVAMHFSQVICLLDIFFWANYFKTAKIKLKLFIAFSLVPLPYALAYLLNFGAGLSWFILALRCSSLAAFLIYIFYGLQVHNLKTIIFAIYLISIVAVLQFLEANFSTSLIFSTKNWITSLDFLGTWIRVPMGSFMGASYAEGVIGSIKRVSGLAIEPGHMSSILFALLPIIVSKRSNLLLTAAWIVTLLASFSKVTLAQLAMFIFLPFFLKFPASTLAFFILINLSLGSLVIRYTGGLEEFLTRYGLSALERFRGFYLYLELPWKNLFTGTGLLNSCQFLPERLLIFSETPGSIAYGESGKKFCTVGIHSAYASLLLDTGILGAALLTFICYFMLKKSQTESTYSLYFRRFSFFCLLMSIQSLHFYSIQTWIPMQIPLALSLIHWNQKIKEN